MSAPPVAAVAAPPLPTIVVIMGAGSSADFGVPTLRGVFKDPSALAYLRRDKKLHDWLQRDEFGMNSGTDGADPFVWS